MWQHEGHNFVSVLFVFRIILYISIIEKMAILGIQWFFGKIYSTIAGTLLGKLQIEFASVISGAISEVVSSRFAWKLFGGLKAQNNLMQLQGEVILKRSSEKILESYSAISRGNFNEKY